MFGFSSGKKINMWEITETLERRRYEYKVISSEIVSLKGRYENHGRDFRDLYLYFSPKEETVSFKDALGRFVTRIPKSVKIKEMYPHIMNILGIVNH